MDDRGVVVMDIVSPKRGRNAIIFLNNHQLEYCLHSPRPSLQLLTHVKLKYQTPCWLKNST